MSRSAENLTHVVVPRGLVDTWGNLGGISVEGEGHVRFQGQGVGVVHWGERVARRVDGLAKLAACPLLVVAMQGWSPDGCMGDADLFRGSKC